MHLDKNDCFILDVIGMLLRHKNENSPKSFMTIHVLTFAALDQIIVFNAWDFMTMYFICTSGEHHIKELSEFE